MIRIVVDDIYSLRSFRWEDKARLVAFANNEKVARNLRDGFPHPYTDETAEQWLDTAIEHLSNSVFVIAQNDLLIGGIGYHPRDDVYRYSAEIGYWLGEPYWGQDIVTRCVGKLVGWIFTNTECLRLFAGVFSNNPASVRVLEKNGFRLEGRLRQAVVKQGVVLDELRHALLREEWLTRKIN
ncbi:MAG: GNAT family N-acetyltransferase [Candidatus Marinimicrobia bacterium]|nr:GNAT family N-acetyltransferase [Candidatus Neomarinimicrobiota bacterium]MCF7840329.1 GNAT family N-acetyltransferase [Candidatus Neomarinimicrobiota bacterium]MCF7902022.1 GNAT family N-acetyltransferase [Candidatus Neomarinimicrobiota bacterium]